MYLLCIAINFLCLDLELLFSDHLVYARFVAKLAALYLPTSVLPDSK